MTTAGWSSTHYNWLRDGLIPAESALLEGILVFPWVNLALASDPHTRATQFSLPWLIALIAFPALVGRRLAGPPRLPWPVRWLALLSLSLCLLLLFIKVETLPGAALSSVFVPSAPQADAVSVAWLVAIVLLGRGIQLALGEITCQSAARWFLGGLAAFLLLFVLLLQRLPPAFDQDRTWLGPLVAVYFVIGLGRLALIRQQELETQTFRRSADRLNLSWVAILSAISGGMLAIAVLIALLGHGALKLLERLGLFVGLLVWQGVVFVWNVSLRLLIFLSGLLPKGRHANRPPGPAVHAASPHAVALPVRLALAAVLIILALALLFNVAVLVYRALQTLPSIQGGNSEGIGEEEHASLWSWDLFRLQLRNVWRMLLGGWRRRRRAGQPEAAPPVEPPLPPPSSVRGLYRTVLRWSRERGRPRQPAETPREFEPALASTMPEDLATALTSAYVQVRYGETAISERQVQRLLVWWDRFVHEAPREQGDGAEQDSAD